MTRIVKAKDFRKLLSDSLGITSRLFKGLLRRNVGEGHSSNHPFSKGAMGFDDYSYKFYNNVVLNPKTIKQINEQEDTFHGVGITDTKDDGGGGGVNDNESILT